jgi:hypothetical protein
MNHTISYVRGGKRFAVTLTGCSTAQAADIAHFLPQGVLLTATTSPETAAIAAVLTTRAELARIPEYTKCS